MGIERKSLVIPASGVIELPAGNIFLLVSATSNVDVRAERSGMSEGFNGVNGGVYIRRVLPWNFLRIVGTVAATVVLFHGQENVNEDETDVRLAVSVIAGTVAVSMSPALGIGNTPAVDANTGAETLLVAANASRKRVQIAADSSNADGGTTATHGGLIRGQTGGNAIDEIQPGVSKWFEVISNLYVRNDSGSTNRFYVREET